ncbi:hypothetical protein [Bacteriovorax sp. DB6_IX]|uniref:hypothetical protein n=1 Tax=Bacteriovorax sp. DB6_IX TaxID=1353530 RepID=UPI00038A52E1|nr:hypothetical protein [Bacteriovorax sp. DB6_IX]EQC51117.1 hypothetical protein M901_2085 [Bacteriovorax sp. DB6_IX]
MMTTNPAYSQSCDKLAQEIKNINDKQNEETFEFKGKPITLKEAKAQRDATLAKALALQALVNIKKDYNDVQKQFGTLNLENLLTKDALKVFKKAEENFDKVYKYGLMRNYVNMMALQQTIDKNYETIMDGKDNSYTPDLDKPMEDLFDYTKSCDRRIVGNHVASMSFGLKNNLNEYVNKQSTPEAFSQRELIINQHKQLCDNAEVMQDLFESGKMPISEDQLRSELSNLNQLYGQMVVDGDKSSMRDEVHKHAQLLNGYHTSGAAGVNNSYLQQMIAQRDRRPFERDFKIAFDMVNIQNGGELAKAYEETRDKKLKASESGLRGPTPLIGSKDTPENREYYKGIQQGYANLKKCEMMGNVEKCRALLNSDSMKDFKDFISSNASLVGENSIGQNAIFDIDNLAKKKEDTLNDKVAARLGDIDKKLQNLGKRSGATDVDSLKSLQSYLKEYEGSALGNCANHINGAVVQKAKLGECLANNLTSELVNKDLAVLSKDVAAYDQAIAQASRKSPTFADYERMKFIASINYSSRCDSDYEASSVNLISPGDGCLSKHMGNLQSTKISGLFKQTNSAISDYFADNFLNEIGDGGKSFVKDRDLWVRLSNSYCEGIDHTTKCSEEDNPMCNTCVYTVKHRQEVFKYHEQSESKKLRKGVYREWDPARKRMVLKEHPISNLWTHTAMYFSKNIGSFMTPRIGMWNFKRNLLMAEQSGMYMKQQYHWQQQIKDMSLSNPTLFQNFYGSYPQGMPITTSQ